MMRNFLLFLAIFILAVSLVTGCKSEEVAYEVRTYEDNTETINAKVNQEFVIALDFDLLHLWREKYDESRLELVEATFDANPRVKRGEEEAGLAEYFRFKALKRGKTEVTLNKMTSDGQRIIEQKVFKVNIER